VLEKSIKQLNRVSISVSLWLELVFGLGLVLRVVLGLVSGFVPSSDIVLKSTVHSSSCVPKFLALGLGLVLGLFVADVSQTFNKSADLSVVIFMHLRTNRRFTASNDHNFSAHSITIRAQHEQ